MNPHPPSTTHSLCSTLQTSPQCSPLPHLVRQAQAGHHLVHGEPLASTNKLAQYLFKPLDPPCSAVIFPHLVRDGLISLHQKVTQPLFNPSSLPAAQSVSPHLVRDGLVSLHQGAALPIPGHSAPEGAYDKQQGLLRHLPPEKEDKAPEQALAEEGIVI